MTTVFAVQFTKSWDQDLKHKRCDNPGDRIEVQFTKSWDQDLKPIHS